MEAAAKNPLENRPMTNRQRPSFKIPVQHLLTKEQKKSISTPQKNITNDLVSHHTSAERTNELCKDTSFRQLMGIENAEVYIESVTQMANGILVSAIIYDTIQPERAAKGYGLLFKMNKDGNVVWIKEFEESSPTAYNYLSITRSFELSNHDIICTGIWNTNPNSDVYKTVIFRLTPEGDVIWKNCIQSNTGLFNSPTGTFDFFVNSAVDGQNGDVLLAGITNSNWSHGKIATAVRINNTGQVVWDANFGNHGFDGSYRFGAEGVSIFMNNGQPLLALLSHGSNNPVTANAIIFATLDYNNGNTIDQRFFIPDEDDINAIFYKGFAYYRSKCIRKDNGHFLFFGPLLSDLVHPDPQDIDHFAVVEFDPGLNFLDAYTISSSVNSNYYNSFLHFDQTGRGLLTIMQTLGNYEANEYFVTFNNKMFQHERVSHYENAALNGREGLAFLEDGGYAYVQSYFQESPTYKWYYEFRKMHNSDTTSSCLGRDTMVMKFKPMKFMEDPDYYFLDPNELNQTAPVSHSLLQNANRGPNQLEPCKQTNYCDTLKIHGDAVICDNSSSLLFTAFKRPDCGAMVEWSIDHSAIDSMKVINDTTTRVWFKNQNWQGQMTASLSAGACYSSPIDAIPVTIIKTPEPLNLGADTVLCTQTSIILKPAELFHTYLWQDGSINPEFVVNQPGKYWLQVSNMCGISYSDTIEIKPLIVSVDLGPDRIKCNNDTLHLEPTATFNKYTWSNSNNTASSSSQELIVNPSDNISYFLKVEQLPGCFAYDTIAIKVNHSPAIQLGPDQRLCEGSVMSFDAGPGFLHYDWSNGNSTRQIIVNTSGSYSVIGATDEGCRSYDTISVEILSNPIVTLDQQSMLCEGSTRTLNAGAFAQYEWQNGSTTSSFVVSSPGTYYVTVWDMNHCKGSDTTKITQLLPSPRNFLPSDTTMCNYGTIKLVPGQTFTNYTWNTHSLQPAIQVSRPGLYWLQVTDANNCTGRDSIVVTPKNCLQGFYIPSAFTPNNDNKNDDFKPIIGATLSKYEFSIYNRWGQIVFTTRDIYKGWNGMYAGINQDSNVFAWICTYQIPGEPVTTRKGTVMLIR